MVVCVSSHLASSYSDVFSPTFFVVSLFLQPTRAVVATRDPLSRSSFTTVLTGSDILLAWCVVKRSKDQLQSRH